MLAFTAACWGCCWEQFLFSCGLLSRCDSVVILMFLFDAGLCILGLSLVFKHADSCARYAWCGFGSVAVCGQPSLLAFVAVFWSRLQLLLFWDGFCCRVDDFAALGVLSIAVIGSPTASIATTFGSPIPTFDV
ncbi:hypothetical protein U1Q18_036409 [Sarracenia purpurea var. burkii]